MKITLNLTPQDRAILLKAIRNEAARIAAYRPDGSQDILTRIAGEIEKA